MKSSSTRKYSAGSVRTRKDIPRSEEAWYVIRKTSVPYTYWSCVEQLFIPWMGGDTAEAYRTEADAEEVAVSIAMQVPNLVGFLDVIKRQ